MTLREKTPITGASSGLGEQMARTSAVRGRDLALCACRTDRLQAFRDELLAARPGNLATYEGSRGRPRLAECIRAEMTVTRTPIAVTTLHPGCIATDLSASAARTLLTTSAEKGARAMARAIERERPEAKVPAWPWIPLGFLIRHLHLRLVAKGS
ncbi:hypothetical protein [Streptomyces sp. NPDC002533]